MTTLYVPGHLPAIQAQRFLDRELKYRRVLSVKVKDHGVEITHESIHLRHVEYM